MALQHFDADTFESGVEKSKGLVLVDFWAQWCGPCKMLAPIIEELASDYDGKAVVGKVDIDEQQGLASKYGIMSIPTLVLFKDGQEVNRLVGFLPKQKIAQMIDNV